jgi:hypothetical protein
MSTCLKNRGTSICDVRDGALLARTRQFVSTDSDFGTGSDRCHRRDVSAELIAIDS